MPYSVLKPAFYTVPIGNNVDATDPSGGILGCPPSTETVTFVLSIAFQVTTLILAGTAIVRGGNPEVLNIVLWMEFVVQLVEVIWYGGVGLYTTLNKVEIEIKYRYADWMITTPVMLVSVMFFAIFEADSACVKGSDLLNSPSRIAAFICIIVFDEIMLFIGYTYEANEADLKRKSMATAKSYLDAIGGLNFGFVPFIGAFVPLVVVAATSYSVWGLVSVLITFFTWALYGVVAIVIKDKASKNTAYNLLDIVSKNLVGIVIAALALSTDYDEICVQ